MSTILNIFLSVFVLMAVVQPVNASTAVKTLPVSFTAVPGQLPGPAPVKTLSPVPSSPDPGAPGTINPPSWYDGLIQYSTITNCVSIIQGLPYQENGVGVYTGFLAQPDAGLPAPNTTYYVHVFIAGLGNSCSGMRAYLDISLPANTSLAVTPTDKVFCFLDGSPIAPASDCPQSLPASPYNPGALAIWSPDAAHAYTWPVPQGHTLEFQIPVKSSTALSNSPMQANIWMLDGNSSPWLRPQQGVYVFSSSPTILYTSPSTTGINPTTAHSEAYLYTFGATGTGYFDLGTTTGYGLIHDPVVISTSGTAWLAWDDWGPPALTPDTLYHWRFIFTPTAGQTIFGADQTFRTLPDGRVTIGLGQSGDCSETALNSALGTAKEILFNCGALPVTISVTSPHSISSNLTIDGGNKVTLAFSGTGNIFNVQSGGHLTLNHMSLMNGNNTAACGGAIKVFAGGQLTLNETRFDNNITNIQGGAVCNYGTTTIANSLFTNNTAGTMGGAIGNYGTLTVSNSKISNNSASVNGGAIDSTGSLVVTNSTFTGNTAGFRGGGINTYLTTLTITGSSFTANSANLYGGGLANDGSTTTVNSSTFSANTSANFGGGIETSGAGVLTLTNITISGNHATTEGGGLYWTPGQGTSPVIFLNSTIAYNVAGTTGGNIYAGGAANPGIQLKNTLIASGSPNNCDHILGSQGSNLESANTCGFAAAGDKINTNPRLGLLQNNSGLTLTHALQAGSAAVDAGTNSGCPATDQRGKVRPIDGDRNGSAVCDIGAFEAPPPQIFIPLVRR